MKYEKTLFCEIGEENNFAQNLWAIPKNQFDEILWYLPLIIEFSIQKSS